MKYSLQALILISFIFFGSLIQAQNIVSAEYYWDTDPGFGSGTSIPIGLPDTLLTFNPSISTAGLSLGIHHLYVRIKDNLGNWSFSTSKLYFVDNTHLNPLFKAEYFWDRDPGFGMGTQIAFNPTNVAVQQVLSIEAPDTLSIGSHQLYLRLRDSLGIWSTYLSDNIHVGDSIFVDESATGLDNGTSWTNAFNDLQSALHSAPRGSIILIAEGNYMPDQGTDSRDSSFYLGPNLHIVGGFPSGGALSPDPELYPTILSGEIGVSTVSTDNSYHVIVSENVGDDVRVENLTVRDAYLNGGNKNSGGGGWYNRATSGTSSLQIKNCKFLNNHAQFHGGAFATLAWVNGIADVQLINCYFELNTADDGGAFSSFVNSNGTINSTLINSIFENNIATDNGGAIYHHTNINSNHQQLNCVFYDNFAAKGGGISHNASPNGDYINCTFAKNRSSLYGGHLDADQIPVDLNILMTNCILGDEHTLSNGPYVTTNTDKVLLQYSLSFMSLNSWIQNGGSNIFNEDPLFIDESLGNLRVTAHSKAINKGLNSVNETNLDPDNNPRIKHGVIDKGAYEVQADTCKGQLIVTGQNCSNPYLWGETIQVAFQPTTGSGLFDIGVNDTIYSQLAPGAIFNTLVAGVDIVGTPPFFHTIALDSIFDANAGCISNIGPNIDNNNLQVTDTIHVQLIAESKDSVFCVGDVIQYTANMTGGSGSYRYRLFLDKNMNGVRNSGELLNSGITNSNSKSWNYVVQRQVNIIGVEILDKLTNCNIDVKFDTTIVDTISPTLLCQDITVSLESNGIALIDASAIDNGSSDNCGLNNLFLNQNNFYCSQEGLHTVTLTGIDWSGNSNTCQATVLVLDDSMFCDLNCSNIVSIASEFGYGSLKHSISCAQLNDTIYFAPIIYGDTIFLEVDSITFKNSLSIITNKANNIIVDASALSTFARVNSGANIWIEGIGIISPSIAPAQAFDNAGNLTLKHINLHHPSVGNEGISIKNTGDLEILGDSNIFKKE